MKRRTFLGLTGAGATSAWLGGVTGARAAGAGESAPDLQFDMDDLAARNQNRSTVIAQNGMVCTSHPLACNAGLDILKAGGNAIDAAVGVNAVLSLVAPLYNGLGGDLFAIVWNAKDQQLHGLNASGRSPKAWTLEAAQEMGLDSIPGNSELAWSVPGCVKGWADLLDRFGSKSFAEVLEPAIYYAKEGFPVSPRIGEDWSFNPDNHPSLAATFMIDGREPTIGEVMTNPDLAHTLEQIARDGAPAFYEGSIAEAIVERARDGGSKMTMEDLRDHYNTWDDPVSATYKGYDVWQLPPNGQGIAALQILNMLEHFDLGAMEPNSPEHLHLIVEAVKVAYEDRAKYYADPEFADVPVDWLISKEYGAERAALIDPGQAAKEYGPGIPEDESDTVLLTTADKDGNMVSLIQSIFGRWGSRIVPEGTGFAMQNRGFSFALDPDHRNRLEGGKRPFHTIIPAFVTQAGRPVFAFGVMGGGFQPQGHVQILVNMLEYGMSPQQASDQPRIKHRGSSSPTGHVMTDGGIVDFERGIPDSTKVALAEKGHVLRPGVRTHGGFQGIWMEPEPRRYFGGSDSRKDGAAVGY